MTLAGRRRAVCGDPPNRVGDAESPGGIREALLAALPADAIMMLSKAAHCMPVNVSPRKHNPRERRESGIQAHENADGVRGDTRQCQYFQRIGNRARQQRYR